MSAAGTMLELQQVSIRNLPDRRQEERIALPR
jgi:hypothetical protein